ncbi:conserved repeat domain-containing protein [Sanguibacter gelidistatuariae]|uniref:Conserved repeat domain-containing protein n=1 Tax=Sanguibacter gelidistatuariae TaxID=1814289 RepID=A0A1G6HNI3_9MICO|nr:DNA alkylation repair protein [Sanguibacter gelidistatuariae]SDB95016.1 conserved repeat domain-containing protein [Sanguibacter gelidistatuariae]
MPTADELLGTDVAELLHRVIATAAPGEPLLELARAAGLLPGLTLRERTDLLSAALLGDLPGSFATLDTTLRRTLADPRLSGWMVWPVTEAVATRALADADPVAFDDALALLADLTGRLTAEFAIRPLLAHDLPRALATIRTWTDHPDEHVRRLASEGTRRFLPWGTRVPALMADPHATLTILDALYRDESDYVRRSVANHLNDLSRHDPAVVVEVARRWLAAPDASTERLVRHALRTLVKAGNPGALELLGFAPAPGAVVDGPALAATVVQVGEVLAFTATVRNTGSEPARLVIDYVVHHRKANGTQTAKVFKITTTTLQPGEHLAVDRRHSFKVISTRRYHPGEHAIELQVNGVASGRASFVLLAQQTPSA